MPFRPCPSGCGRFLFEDYGHDLCLQCLGLQHAEDAFVDDSCACCGHMSMTLLQSRLSFLKGLAPSAATSASLSGSSRRPPAGALGDLRVTVRASPPDVPMDLLLLMQWTSHPVPGWFRWFVPRGAQNLIRCAIWGQDVDRSFGGWAYVLWGWRCVEAAPSGVIAKATPDQAYPAWRISWLEDQCMMHWPPLPPGTGLSLPRHRGRPSASSRAAPPHAESTPRPVVEPLTGERHPPEILEFALSPEMARTAPLLPPVEGREENPMFRFLSVPPSSFLKERSISFSSGFLFPWDDSIRCLASSFSLTNHLASSQESVVQGRSTSPRTSSPSRLGPRKFGKDASERAAFYTIQPLYPHATILNHRWLPGTRSWLLSVKPNEWMHLSPFYYIYSSLQFIPHIFFRVQVRGLEWP